MSTTKFTLGEGVDFVKSLGAKRIAELDHARSDDERGPFSLQRFYLCPGDIAFLPAGMISVEKTVGCSSVASMALRICSCLVNDSTVLELGACLDASQGWLALILYVCFELWNDAVQLGG